MWMLLDNKKCRRGVLNGASKAKPGGEWNTPRGRNRNISEIENYNAETTRLEQEVDGFEGLRHDIGRAGDRAERSKKLWRFCFVMMPFRLFCRMPSAECRVPLHFTR